MKTIIKLFIVILCCVFELKSEAQITLLKTIPNALTAPTDNFQMVYLKHSGYKFVFLHSDTLTFYNQNLSLMENAVFPANWLTVNFNVEYISEGLFDNDTLHIDYLLLTGGGDSTVVYKDNGNVVFRNDTAISYFSSPGMGFISSPIVTTDSGTFMILYPQINSYSVEIFKLPGSLPCIPGCSGGDFPESESQISKTNYESINIYPNPAVSFTNIYYILPPGNTEGEIVLYDLAGRTLKKYTVTNQFNHIQLTTSDLSAGTYLYQLIINGISVSAKKVVIVK